MSSVLVDSWTLGYVLGRITGAEASVDLQSHKCISGLITGILFWDEIDWIPSGLVASRLEVVAKSIAFSNLTSVLNPVNLPDFTHYHEKELTFNKYSYSVPDDDKIKQDLFKRVQEYQRWSAALGANYMPHPSRAEYMIKNSLVEKFSREVLLEIPDKEVIKFYNEINEELGRNYFCCCYPMLYDYIRFNASSVEEQILYALELREDKYVTKLRRDFGKLDDYVNEGDVQYLARAVKQIKELSKEVIYSYEKDTHKIGDLTISLSPSLRMPLEFKKNKKILNLTFLNDLLVFSVQERLGLY